MLGRSTSKMTVSQLSELIEFIYGFLAEHGIVVDEQRLTPKQRKHLATIKSMPCGVCGAEGDTEAHHIEQHKQYLCIPLCSDCHRGGIQWLAWSKAHLVGSQERRDVGFERNHRTLDRVINICIIVFDLLLRSQTGLG